MIILCLDKLDTKEDEDVGIKKANDQIKDYQGKNNLDKHVGDVKGEDQVSN